MANIKYFNGTQQLKGIHGLANADFAARFPRSPGRRHDGYTKEVGYPLAGTGGALPVERVIEYKQFASKHDCDARCLNAQGKIMKCECSCGGVNHGRGAGTFTKLIGVEVTA